MVERVMDVSPAAIIARHEIDFAGVRCGVVAVEGNELVVCSGWWRPGTKYFGWEIERIANTRAAVREWLGY